MTDAALIFRLVISLAETRALVEMLTGAELIERLDLGIGLMGKG